MLPASGAFFSHLVFLHWSLQVSSGTSSHLFLDRCLLSH